ncbi:hypothetical protein Tco_0028695, partial [Tanacetum coccineum]
FEDASDACALAKIHALAFEISEKEGFALLSLPPDFEPRTYHCPSIINLLRSANPRSASRAELLLSEIVSKLIAMISAR